MSSKKKLITAITSLAVVAVIAVVAVTVTLAALNATVSSGFSITYTAYNVSAEITGKYSDSTHTTLTAMQAKDPDSGETLTFNGAEDNNASKSFETLSLTFSAKEQDIYLVYSIKNTSAGDEAAAMPVSFTMTYTGDSNLTIQYHQFESDPETSAESENGYKGFAYSTAVESGRAVTLTQVAHTTSNTTWVVFKFHMQDNTDPVALTNGNLVFTLGTPAED